MSTQANHVVISSKDRIDPLNMTPQSFTISLQNGITNFDYFQLINVMLPNTYYNITNKIGNTALTINNTTYNITEGNYGLSEYVSALNAAISPSIPGFSMTFNPIICQIQISTTSIVTINFSQNSATALTLGFGQLDLSANLFTADLPPSLSPLGILINLDCVASTTSLSNLQGLRSSSFMVNDNTNSLEYVQFYENSQYSHTVRSNKSIINTIQINVYDLNGYPLQNLGEWVMVLRFVRKRPDNPGF
jgi:hypothetical protein